jgi:hypothetical protein
VDVQNATVYWFRKSKMAAGANLGFSKQRYIWNISGAVSIICRRFQTGYPDVLLSCEGPCQRWLGLVVYFSDQSSLHIFSWFVLLGLLYFSKLVCRSDKRLIKLLGE